MPVRTRHRLAVAVIALVTAACGTTVPLDQQGVAPSAPQALGTDAAMPNAAAGGDGLGTTGAGTGGAAPGAPAGTAGAAGAPAAGGAAGGGQTTGTAGATGGQQSSAVSRGGGAGGTGPGVDADSIHVGMYYSNDGDQANESTGFESNTADARQVYNAIIKDINRRGGVLGRRLKPVYFRVSAVTSQTLSEQAQAGCAHWHEDNEVFGVLGFPHPVVLECTQKVGGVSVGGVLGTFLTDTFRQYPEFIEPGGMDVETQAAVTINGLARQGYFSGGAPTGTKVGILTFDHEGFRRAVEGTAIPALARHGIPEPEVQYISPPQRIQEVGNSSSEVQSAVLRFKSQNVTHVVILEGAAGIAGGGHLMMLFTNSAEAQAYRPRYGLNSGSGLNGVSPQTPEGQLDKARAVGWVDPWDMPDRERMSNPAVERCRRIMKRAGLPSSGVPFADTQVKCEHVFFFAAAMESGGVPHRDGFIAGAHGLGTGHTSTVALATRFAPDQHDGVAAVRDAKYVPACRCFHPASQPYRP
jgi:hypothetical protein